MKKRRSRQFKNKSQVVDMDKARKERLERRRAERAREEKKEHERSKGRYSRRDMQLRRKQNFNKAVISIIIVIMLIIAGVALGKIIKLKHDLNKAKAQQEEYEETKKELMKELEESEDLNNLEEQARSQLRLIKPGENLYIFSDDFKNDN